MTDLLKAAEMALEALIESARSLGRVEARKEFGCYSQEDCIFETGFRKGIHQHKEALRQALAQPEQEPVARVDYDRNGNIAWLYGPIEPDGTLLYTAPPKREWVGLTEKQYAAIETRVWNEHIVVGGVGTGVYSYALWKEIEAKLKEKNLG